MLNTLSSPFISLPGPPGCGRTGSCGAGQPQHTLGHVTAATDPAQWGPGAEYNCPKLDFGQGGRASSLTLAKKQPKLLWDL